MSTLISIKNFGQEYSVSRSTIYRLRDAGKIPFVHVGRAVRIKKEDAERWYAGLRDNADND